MERSFLLIWTRKGIWFRKRRIECLNSRYIRVELHDKNGQTEAEGELTCIYEMELARKLIPRNGRMTVVFDLTNFSLSNMVTDQKSMSFIKGLLHCQIPLEESGSLLSRVTCPCSDCQGTMDLWRVLEDHSATS